MELITIVHVVNLTLQQVPTGIRVITHERLVEGLLPKTLILYQEDYY